MQNRRRQRKCDGSEEQNAIERKNIDEINWLCVVRPSCFILDFSNAERRASAKLAGREFNCAQPYFSVLENNKRNAKKREKKLLLHPNLLHFLSGDDAAAAAAAAVHEIPAQL